jgi:transcriptional regulator with XRE-family HTH domain
VAGILNRTEMPVTTFAERVGIKRQHVYQWVNGRYVPDEFVYIAAVAQVAGDEVAVALKAAGYLEVPTADEQLAKIDAAQADDWTKEMLRTYVRMKRSAVDKYVDYVLRHAPPPGRS